MMDSERLKILKNFAEYDNITVILDVNRELGLSRAVREPKMVHDDFLNVFKTVVDYKVIIGIADYKHNAVPVTAHEIGHQLNHLLLDLFYSDSEFSKMTATDSEFGIEKPLSQKQIREICADRTAYELMIHLGIIESEKDANDFCSVLGEYLGTYFGIYKDDRNIEIDSEREIEESKTISAPINAFYVMKAHEETQTIQKTPFKVVYDAETARRDSEKRIRRNRTYVD